MDKATKVAGLSVFLLLLTIPVVANIKSSQLLSQNAASLPQWQNIDIPGVSENFNSPANNYGYNSIVVDPTNPSILFVGTNYQGLYKSTDSGTTWTKISTGTGSDLLSNGRMWTLAIDPFNHNTLWTTSGYGNGGPLKSTDGGVSWTHMNLSGSSTFGVTNNDVYTISVDPYTPNHVIASFHGWWTINGTSQGTSGVIETKDGGATWTIHYPPSGVGTGNGIWFLGDSNTWLFGCQSGGFWRTTDGGQTWSQVITNDMTHGETEGLLKEPTSGVFYVSAGTDIRKSSDNGATWSVVGSGLPNAYYETVVSDGINLYTTSSYPCGGTCGTGTIYYIPLTGGTTWQQYGTVKTCDPSGTCNGMVMGAYDSVHKIIYTTNWLGGLWKLDSSGVATQPTVTLAQPTPTTGSSVPITGLHVSGNQILNGSNQPVKLVGVNRSGAEYECNSGGAIFDGPSDLTSVQAIVSWHVDIVRIQLNEECWLGINGIPAATSGTNYQNAIVNFVNLLNQNGIAAIMDLQWNAAGTAKANGQVPMPDRDHSPAFWTSVATTFKGNNSVLFDLFNEPYPDNNSNTTAAWSCLRDGGTCNGVSYTAAGTQELVNAIRGTGATNIIMVPGVQYTNVLSSWLTYKPTDTTGNLVASWHSYNGQICSSQSCWDSQIAPVMQQVPLIGGEIGENDCAHGYIDTLMPWLDSHNGNYLAWAWDTYDCSSFPALITNYNGTPTNYGIGFRDHLAALAGSGPTPTPGPTNTPAPSPTLGPSVTPAPMSVSTVTLYNEQTNTVVSTLTNGKILDGSTLPLTCMNIGVITNPSTVGSVVFGYDGNQSYHIESTAPYYIGGDNGTTGNCWGLTVGTHTLTVTPYSGSGGTGSAGTPITISFTVTQGTNPTVTPTITQQPTVVQPTVTSSSVPGDANGDGKVDLADLSLLAAQWQKTGSGLSADFNHDNIVDLTDFSILAGHWNG